MIARGFETREFRDRVSAAQRAMARQDLAALFLTSEADLRYFTGFLTRFWESPTRPWFLIVPAQGDPVAVIPSIGADLMSKTWISDIRTWRAPAPEDDGVSLLRDSLSEIAAGGWIGVPMVLESSLRMPLADWYALQKGLTFVPDGGLVASLRAIKSEAEIAKIRTACEIAARAFARVPEIAGPGAALDQVFRDFQRLALEEGADWVPYLAGGAGSGGYGDVISPATGQTLRDGDVMMLDTGLIHDGYFCDYDRNFAITHASAETRAAHARLIEATGAAVELARPGARACDLYHAMADVLGGGNDAGRLGHGLGMQLTEGLSLIPQDQSEMKPGMVITVEPGITLPSGAIMVHEEDIVIRDSGAEFLSPRSGPEIPVLR